MLALLSLCLGFASGHHHRRGPLIADNTLAALAPLPEVNWTAAGVGITPTAHAIRGPATGAF